MKKIFFLLMICSLISCTEDSDGTNSYVVHVGSLFHILNDNNEDLLNTETPNTLNSDDIRMEYLHKDGNFKVFFYEYLDSKYGYEIYTEQAPYVFACGNSFREFMINNKITGIVKWNATERDTIVTEINETSNSITKTKVWVNGELKYDMHNGLTPEVITIVK